MRDRPGRRVLLAFLLVAIGVTGCGGGGGNGSGSACHPGGDLGDPNDGPVADAAVASRPLLGIAAGVRGAPEVAASIAPVASPGYQSLEVGKRATWEVAVLQLADRPRTLQVDFGDGGASATLEVPAGDGACLFDVSHTFDNPLNRRPVKFTLAGGPSFEAFIDVVAKT